MSFVHFEIKIYLMSEVNVVVLILVCSIINRSMLLVNVTRLSHTIYRKSFINLRCKFVLNTQ